MTGWSWHLDGWIVLAGVLSACSCALLGNYLVLRRMSLMGDAISHAVLPGLAIAFLVTHSRSAVPMFAGTLLPAILLVGPKLSGDVFTSQDVDLLATLGSEAGAAVAYARLHQDAMQAERLATLGGLAAGIAHEVKNPLVAVRTFAELLPEQYADPEFREEFSTLVLGEVDR